MKRLKKIKLIEGESIRSVNGTIKFFNNFKLNRIKRFYHIRLPHKNLIRAFHGHILEEKYAYVIQGSLMLYIVKLDNSKAPSKNLKPKGIVLDSDTPKIVHIPKNSANGIKSLSKNTEVIFFSTLNLSESLKDDFRFPYDYWGKDIWN